jgi:hypothetical protein
MYKVRGRKMAIAIDICKPGIAPKIKPINMPGTTINHNEGSEKSKVKPPITSFIFIKHSSC